MSSAPWHPTSAGYSPGRATVAPIGPARRFESDADADLPALSVSGVAPVPAGQTTDITALFSGQERELAGVGPQAKAGGTGDPGSIVRITGRAAFGFAEANIES